MVRRRDVVGARAEAGRQVGSDFNNPSEKRWGLDQGRCFGGSVNWLNLEMF